MTALSRNHLIAALALGSAALLGSPAHAEVLTLQVQVANNCSVTAATLDFGVYESGQASTLHSNIEITYSGCPITTRISLDQGVRGNRRLASEDSDDLLAYSLTDINQEIWGSGEDAKKVPTSGSGTMTLFGQINGNQSAAFGTYTDSVQMTVSF